MFPQLWHLLSGIVATVHPAESIKTPISEPAVVVKAEQAPVTVFPNPPLHWLQAGVVVSTLPHQAQSPVVILLKYYGVPSHVFAVYTTFEGLQNPQLDVVVVSHPTQS